MFEKLKAYLSPPDSKYSSKEILIWLWDAWKGNRLQAFLNAFIGLAEVVVSLTAVWAIQNAIDKVGYDIAYYQESLHFWYKGGEKGTMRLPGVVVARYDTDGKLMLMTMRPDTLQRYAALQMLKDQGIFDYTESND